VTGNARTPIDNRNGPAGNTLQISSVPQTSARLMGVWGGDLREGLLTKDAVSWQRGRDWPHGPAGCTLSSQETCLRERYLPKKLAVTTNPSDRLL